MLHYFAVVAQRAICVCTLIALAEGIAGGYHNIGFMQLCCDHPFIAAFV